MHCTRNYNGTRPSEFKLRAGCLFSGLANYLLISQSMEEGARPKDVCTLPWRGPGRVKVSLISRSATGVLNSLWGLLVNFMSTCQ